MYIIVTIAHLLLQHATQLHRVSLRGGLRATVEFPPPLSTPTLFSSSCVIIFKHVSQTTGMECCKQNK